MLYFIKAFVTELSENSLLVFLNKITQLSLSVGAIGILFMIHHYPGFTIMLKASFFSLIASLTIKIIVKFKSREKESILDPDIVRLLIMIVAIALILISGE
jgi:hypothetical protein